MFHKGDRVMVWFPEDLSIGNLRHFSKYYNEGECGTVLRVEHDNPLPFAGVAFDNYRKDRHNLDGACDDGHGYWLYEKFLIPEEPDLDCGPVDLSKILEVD